MNWKAFFCIRRRDGEINDEIEAHLRMAIQDRIERGESLQDARSSAFHEFGAILLVKEAMREVWISRALAHARPRLRCALTHKIAGLQRRCGDADRFGDRRK